MDSELISLFRLFRHSYSSDVRAESGHTIYSLAAELIFSKLLLCLKWGCDPWTNNDFPIDYSNGKSFVHGENGIAAVFSVKWKLFFFLAANWNECEMENGASVIWKWPIQQSNKICHQVERLLWSCFTRFLVVNQTTRCCWALLLTAVQICL